MQQVPPEIQQEVKDTIVRIETQVQSGWSKYWPAIAAAVSILLLASMVWLHFNPKVQAATTYTTMPPIPAAANVATQELPVQRVVVLVKQEAVKALKPPPEIANDPKVQITATAAVPPSPYGGSAIAFLNTTTGRAGISYKATPRPFFEFKTDLDWSLDYGVTTKGKQQAAGDLRWTFMRTAGINWHARGEVNSEPEAKALLGIHGAIPVDWFK